MQYIMRDVKEAFLGDLPVVERRLKINAAADRAIRLPRGVNSNSIFANGVPANWIEPDSTIPGHAILYLHGGGYIIGSPSTHRGLAGNLALASNSRLLLIDYRLAPENPFPAALEDALAGYAWLQENGFSPENIAVAGDSAGGGLALATSLALRDDGKDLPAALALLSPWTDLTFSGDSITARAKRDPFLRLEDQDWMVQSYSGGKPLTHPYISPLFANLKGLPPTLIQVGTEEILYDDSFRLEKEARKAGVDVTLESWQGMWHVFQGFAPYVPESKQALSHLGAFLKNHMG